MVRIFFLTCLCAAQITIVFQASAQTPPPAPYGNNPAAGKYLAMKDGTRIYYEVYGSGRPIVLLHGGLYDDISEYEKLIPVLSQHFQVIAIETRGHGKSEIGRNAMTYSLFSGDAYEINRHLTADSILLIGFSDGR